MTDRECHKYFYMTKSRGVFKNHLMNLLVCRLLFANSVVSLRTTFANALGFVLLLQLKNIVFRRLEKNTQEFEICQQNTICILEKND